MAVSFSRVFKRGRPAAELLRKHLQILRKTCVYEFKNARPYTFLHFCWFFVAKLFWCSMPFCLCKVLRAKEFTLRKSVSVSRVFKRCRRATAHKFQILRKICVFEGKHTKCYTLLHILGICQCFFGVLCPFVCANSCNRNFPTKKDLQLDCFKNLHQNFHKSLQNITVY